MDLRGSYTGCCLKSEKDRMSGSRKPVVYPRRCPAKVCPPFLFLFLFRPGKSPPVLLLTSVTKCHPQLDPETQDTGPQVPTSTGGNKVHTGPGLRLRHTPHPPEGLLYRGDVGPKGRRVGSSLPQSRRTRDVWCRDPSPDIRGTTSVVSGPTPTGRPGGVGVTGSRLHPDGLPT